MTRLRCYAYYHGGNCNTIGRIGLIFWQSQISLRERLMGEVWNGDTVSQCHDTKNWRF